MAIVRSEYDTSVWLLTNDTGSERYVMLHGTLEFISNPINALEAAMQTWEGQVYPSFKMVVNSGATFEQES